MNFVAFTRAQAPGAWPNGSRVEKAASEPGDAHAIGSPATVLGSIAIPNDDRLRFGYFVAWTTRRASPCSLSRTGSS